MELPLPLLPTHVCTITTFGFRITHISSEVSCYVSQPGSTSAQASMAAFIPVEPWCSPWFLACLLTAQGSCLSLSAAPVSWFIWNRLRDSLKGAVSSCQVPDFTITSAVRLCELSREPGLGVGPVVGPVDQTDAWVPPSGTVQTVHPAPPRSVHEPSSWKVPLGQSWMEPLGSSEVLLLMKYVTLQDHSELVHLE